MRFQVSTLDEISWVWDHLFNIPVQHPEYVDGYSVRWEFTDADEAQKIADTLNQRVEHPELTRADGKLVSV
jgi:hypothetical protein